MPEPKELVINTTPIISLIAATGTLDMLPLLYSRVWVPFEVCREIQAGGADGYYIVIELDGQQKPVTIDELLPYLKLKNEN